jgi:hypothetical protein
VRLGNGNENELEQKELEVGSWNNSELNPALGGGGGPPVFFINPFTTCDSNGGGGGGGSQ